MAVEDGGCEDAECTCIPENAMIVAELRVLEYLDPETGEAWKADLSHDGSGGPLDPDKTNALAEWAKQVASIPMLAALMHEMFCDHDEEEE